MRALYWARRGLKAWCKELTGKCEWAVHSRFAGLRAGGVKQVQARNPKLQTLKKRSLVLRVWMFLA